MSDKMEMTAIASEYLISAQVLKTRIDELKETTKTKKNKEQKSIEERLTILDAEYDHLLNVGGYLSSYYKKQKNVSRIGGALQ